MRIDIGNFHTEQKVAEVSNEGDLQTDSEAFREVASEYIEDGIYSVFPVSVENDEGETEVAYHEFHIEPGDRGFLREFVDAIPSPYDCDLDVLDDLPTFDPEANVEKADFPPWCRSCGENVRMSGSFVCPSCHPGYDEDEYDGDLAGGDDVAKSVQEKIVEGAVSVFDDTHTKDNAVTTGDAGYSNAVYGGVSGTSLDYDHWESEYMDISKAVEGEGMSFDEFDKMLFEVHKNVVWWEPEEGDDLSKAPNMWRSDDQVPEFVKEFIKEVVKQGVIYDRLDGLPHTAALKIQDIFEERLTQPQGWSINSLTKDLADAFESLSVSRAEDIARTETAAIMNTAREEAYKERPDEEEYEYYWSNAQDHRTTDLCNDIIAEIDSRGGAVPLPELKDILKDAANDYDYGTPNRVDEWLPHFKCRSTFVREVYL